MPGGWQALLGAFVVATESRREVDLVAAITAARDTLGTVLEALATRRTRAEPEPRVRVRVRRNDGRWAIRASGEPWWTVSMHTEENLPVQVADDWVRPGLAGAHHVVVDSSTTRISTSWS